MSYGTVQGVADLSGKWTDNGSYTASSPTTSTEVSGWLTDVSQMIDAALADEGFVTPITDSDITSMLALLCEGVVKDIVDYSHQSGRYFTKKAMESGISPFMAADQEIHDWVKRKTNGLIALGAEQIADFFGRNTASFEVF